MALFLIAAGGGQGGISAQGPVAVHAASAPAPPTPRNLTFYMHNNTLARDINGVSTPYLFDTLQKFGQNNTVSKLQDVRQDWYLFPILAGNLTANGTITLHAFVSVSLVGAQITPTLTISEVNVTGASVWTASVAPGAITWWATPHDLVLTLPGVHRTFGAGSTILVVLDIVSGSRVATIWYNASWVPTHLIVQSDDFARVDSLTFLDSTGTPRTSFDPLAANKNIDIRVNVTDPLGGYDVHWVNVTLQRPGGALVLTNAPMTKTAGTPASFASTYGLVWSYSGQPVGRYNATASVLDDSGFYYFAEFFATDGFLSAMDGTFYIGGLPEYVNVQAIDSKAAPLGGATIDLLSGGVLFDVKTADATGRANFSMKQGTYEFRVVWQSIEVGSRTVDVASNVSAASPLILTTAVYYPIFRANDADGKALADASLIFVHPNGQELGPYKTNATGDVMLAQVPGGTYGLAASWRGVDVFNGSETVNSNAIIPFTTAVYELTVITQSGAGQLLPGVFVSVTDSTGLVFDAGITGTAGSVVLRLPGGTYTVNARYITSVGGTFYDSGLRSSNVTLTSSTSATVTFGDYPIPLTSTLQFQFGLAYGITVAALLVAFFLFWRWKKSAPATPPAGPEKKA